MRRLVLLVLAASAVAYACASLKEAPITEPATDAGAETGADAAADAPADAPADTRTFDVEPDAGIVFTDTFDDGGRSPAWDDYAAGGTVDAGDLTVGPPGLSPPNSFHVASSQAPFYGGIQWFWPAAASRTRLRVSLDLFVTTAPNAPAVVVMNVIDGSLLHEADNSPAPILVVAPNPANVNEVRLSAYNLENNSADPIGHVFVSIAIGTWRHVEMSYEPVPVDSDFWRVSWALDTPPIVAYSKVVPRPATIDTTSRSTFLGVQSASARADVRFDNVKIDLR